MCVPDTAGISSGELRAPPSRHASRSRRRIPLPGPASTRGSAYGWATPNLRPTPASSSIPIDAPTLLFVVAHHVEADDVGGFADKLRVIALAPGLAAGQIDLLRSQETPDILLMNVAEFARQQQRSRPVGVARRGRS